MNFFKTITAALFVAIAVPASAQVLYKVEGNGLESPSYVFGTHHLAPISVIDQFGAKAPYESVSHDGTGRQHFIKSNRTGRLHHNQRRIQEMGADARYGTIHARHDETNGRNHHDSRYNGPAGHAWLQSHRTT